MPETLNEAITRSLRLSTRSQQINQFVGTKSDRTTYDSIEWVESRTGIQNPRWRDQVAQKAEAGTAYSLTGKVKYVLGRRGLDVTVRNYYGHASIPDDYFESNFRTFVSLPGAAISSSKAYASALGNFLTNVNGALSPFKGMVFLGELRETLKMLRRPASALRDGFSTYLKRARREVRRHGRRSPKLRKVLGDTWLEYYLGWRPLIGSIEDAAGAYKAFADEVKTSFVIGQGRDETFATSTTFVDFAANHCYWIGTDKRVSTDTVKFKGEVVHRYDGVATGTADRIIDLSGFRLEEFVPTIWELIPYSFVVDYFTNIGEILNSVPALSANLAWKSCSRWQSAIREVGYKADLPLIRSSLGPNREPIIVEVSNPSWAERLNYSRTVPVLTAPSLVLTLPQSPWQWLTLAALINAKL